MKYENINDTQGLRSHNKKNINKMPSKDKKTLAKVVQFDLLKEITENLKNFTATPQSKWKSLIKKLKNYTKVFNIKGDKFPAFIAALLPLLGAFLGAMYSFKTCEEEEQKVSQPEIKPKDSDSFTSDPEKVIAEMRKLLDDTSKSAKVIDYCIDNKHGFSRTFIEKTNNGKNNGKASDEDTDKNCIISMCPPVETTNLENLFGYDPTTMPQGIVIEYDERYPHSYNINEGQILEFCDNIGNINGLPVKSQIRGIVTEKHDNYFIVNYLDDLPVLDTDKLIQQYQNTKLEEINELFLKNMNAVNFIKDYLYELRLPSLVNHTLGAPMPLNAYIKLYNEMYKNMLSSYEDRTRRLCSSENIQAYGKANQLDTLKQKLDDDRKQTLKEIIKFYNNYKTLGFASLGRIADYMMYDEYMDYLTDNERFNYDDSNPFVVKEFNLLCKFIGRRSKIEKNISDLPALISKFNNNCKDLLKEYWHLNSYDYYAEIKKIFQYDYYTNDEDVLIQTVETDKDAVTLFSKVNRYLQNLVNYIPVPDKVIEYSENIDVNTLLKSGGGSGQNDVMAKDLRKIAIEFCMIRNIETGENSNDIFDNGIATQANVSAFKALNIASGPLIQQYCDVYVENDPIVLAALPVLRPYLNTLKKLAISEEHDMGLLAKEAIQWYEENGDKVNDKHIFDSFKEVNWNSETLIYKDNKPYNYMYLTYEEDKSDTGKDKPGFDFESEENDEYYDSGAYIKSSNGPNDMNYWIKYLSLATVVNCMLPIYWGTGLIISGTPIIMPIIMIPLYVLSGRVTAVFGIGLCGICPMPLVLFANLGNTLGSILIPLNILADILKKSLQQTMNNQKPARDAKYAAVIKALDNKITQYNNDIDSVESAIHNIDVNIQENKKILRNIKKRKKEDPTSNRS